MRFRNLFIIGTLLAAPTMVAAQVSWSVSDTYVPSNPFPNETVEKRVTITLDAGSDSASCANLSRTFQGSAKFSAEFAYTVDFADWRQSLRAACQASDADNTLEAGDSFTFTIATLTPPQGGVSEASFSLPVDVHPPGKGPANLRGSFDVAPAVPAPVVQYPASAEATGSTSADVTITTDQGTGTVYWAAMPIDWNNVRSISTQFQPPADLQNPTGARSSGSFEVTSSGERTFTVNNLLPTPQEEYFVYFQHVNSSGNVSDVESSVAIYTDEGTTVPLLDMGHGTPISPTTADIRVLSTEDEGTLSWVVTTSSTPPTVAQIEAGQDHTGTSATLAVSKNVTQNNIQHWPDQGPLAEGVTHYAHFAHRTGAGVSAVFTSDGFVPQDVSTPVALAQVVNGTGQGYSTPMQSETWRELGERIGDICAPGPDPSVYKSGINNFRACMLGMGAWTTAAFDDERFIYYRGGGHQSYEGNEVYRFDIATGDVVRMHNSGRAIPQPYSPDFADHWYEGFYHEGMPTSSHHYDHLNWANDRLIMGPNMIFRDQTGTYPKVSEWNPDGPHHGYALGVFDWQAEGFEAEVIRICSALDPATGDLLVVTNSEVVRYDPVARTAISLGNLSLNMDDGSCFYDADTQTLYTWDLNTGSLLTAEIGATTLSNASDYAGFSSGYFWAARNGVAKRTMDGEFYVWGGGTKVWRWDQRQVPAADITEIANSATVTSPGDGCGYDDCKFGAYESRGVYGKWWYIESLDVFIGLDDPGEPIWVWKP